MPEDEFIKFRLKQGVYGQRQPDVQMIRVKLPFGGITPEQMESFADVIEKYVPLNKGHITTRQNIQMHHIPLPEVEKAIRELGESGLSSREGCGNTVQERDRRSVGGRGQGRAVRHDALRGRLRALLRAPPHDAGDAAQDQDGVRRLPARPGDLRHPRHRLQGARTRDRRPGEVRGAEMLVGGGTSIMPRVAPALYEFVELDNGDYLKIAEAVFRIFDRQEWLRVNRARARIKVFVDKYGIDELRSQVEEELKGTGSRTGLLDRASAVRRRRARGRARAGAELRQPEWRPLGVRALPRRRTCASRSRRAS